MAWILYNSAMGPGVETCVCALCNDFGIKAEGTFHSDGKGRLQKTYKVVCTDERWKGFSSLEQRFRHVVDVSKGTVGRKPERYFISERGLQNKVAGNPDEEDKWRWWTEDDTESRDFESARIFVCHACDTPKTSHPSFAAQLRSEHVVIYCGFYFYSCLSNQTCVER